MKHSLLFLSCFFLLLQANAQNADAIYKKGDSLYKIKDFKNAARSYTAAIVKEGKEAEPERFWNAATLWVQAGVADSAFYILNLLTKSNKVSIGDANIIFNNKDLAMLRKDVRWLKLTDQLKAKANSNYPMEEFIYGRKDGTALTMLQLKPKTKTNNRAIVRVIAGSWFSSYRLAEYYIRPSSMYLEKGYTVFLVIVGSQPRFDIPAQIIDVKRAVRYIRYNANKFGIDPNHLGIEGVSAGGHLSLAVATADDIIDKDAIDPVDRVSSRVQAVAVLFPPTDLLSWGGPGRNFINTKAILLAYKIYGAVDFKVWNDTTATYDAVTDTSARLKIAKEISPINAVTPDDPPVFIMHGTADVTVPIQQSEIFIAKLKEAGVPNNFIIKKGGRHNPADMQPELKQFVDWFDKYLK